MTFDEMLREQNALQLTGFQIDILGMTTEERIAFFKDMKLAISAELQEALDEMGWKPWASSKHFHAPEVMHELVDVFHFFANLVLTAGFEAGYTIGDMANYFEAAYEAKREVNRQRQEKGYDGVSTKCPHCHRELTEVPDWALKYGRCSCGNDLDPDRYNIAMGVTE